MILANGCPKSGTHALMSMLQAAGHERWPGILKVKAKGRVKLKATLADPEVSLLAEAEAQSHRYFIHGHIPVEHRDRVSRFQVVTVIRDPRNVLISYLRMRRQKGSVDLQPIDVLRDFYGYRFIEHYRGWLGWRDHGPCLRYEALGDVGDGTGLYRGKVSNNTYTGELSNWREWWTPELSEAWKAQGGMELLKEAGYE